MRKGDKQFVKIFFPIKAFKRLGQALHTYKFRMDVLRRLDKLEKDVQDLKMVQVGNYLARKKEEAPTGPDEKEAG